MKVTLFIATAVLTLNGAVQAQTTDHAAHHPPAASAAAATMSDGEVRKVDKEQGKVTLKHGRIENLDMPGMTMVFKVSDPKMLDNLTAGDRVRFVAENVNGTLTVTAIQVVN